VTVSRLHSKTRELGGESVPRLLIRYSIPTTLGFAAFSIYNIIDRAFIGKFAGSDALAGISITFPLFMVCIAIGMLIGIGGGTLTSLRLGEGRYDQAERILGTVLASFVVSGLVLTALGQIFLDPLLRLFGAGPAIIPFSRAYMRILMSVITVDFIAMGTNGMIRAEGNPAISMAILGTGAVLNVGLDYLFVVRWGWGVEGAALATALAKTVSAVLIFRHFIFGRTRVLTLRLRNLTIDPALARAMLYIGASPFTLQFVYSVFVVLTNRFLLRYGGDTAIGAMGIIHSLLIFLMMPIIGLNQGSQPIIGFNYGAENFDRVLAALKACLSYAGFIGLAGLALVEFFPLDLASIFTPDPVLRATAARGMRLMLAMIPLGMFQVVIANYFQATGRPLVSISLNLLRMIIFYLPLLYLLSALRGLDGVWMTTPGADILTFSVAAAILFREFARVRALIPAAPRDLL